MSPGTYRVSRPYVESMVDVQSLSPGRYAVLVAVVAFLSATVGGLAAGDEPAWAVGRAGAIGVGVGAMVFALRGADPG
jgi:hypothetical protein